MANELRSGALDCAGPAGDVRLVDSGSATWALWQTGSGLALHTRRADGQEGVWSRVTRNSFDGFRLRCIFWWEDKTTGLAVSTRNRRATS